MRKTVNIYTPKLTLWVMFCMLFIRLFYSGNISLYVVNKIALGFIVRLIRRIVLLCATIKLVEDDLGDFTGPEGQHLQMLRDQLLNDLFKVKTEQIDFSRLSDAIGGYYEDDELRRFSSRIIVHYYWKLLAEQLLLWGVSEKHTGKKILIASIPIEARAWRALLELRFQIIPSILCSWNVEMLKWMLRLLKQYLRAVMINHNETNISNEKKIAVQMILGPKPKRRAGDLDWMSGSELQGKDLVYYLDGDIRKGINRDDVLQWCQERKIEFVDLVGWIPSANSNGFGARLLKIITGQLLLPFRRVSSLRNVGFSGVVTCIFACYAERWRTFLLEKNICGCINVSDTNLSALPQVWAVESVDGVDLSFEFSATGYHSFFEARPLGHHQYAVWGNLTYEMVRQCERKAGVRIGPKYYFLTGNMRHYLKHRNVPELDELRTQIRNHQGPVIGVFDVIWTRLKITSRKQSLDFIDAVLILVNNIPDALFVFKPQKKMLVNDAQADQINYLISERRLILIEAEILPHQIYDQLDLAVGSKIFSSALMEALSANVPVVYFDNNSWQHIMREKLDASFLAQNKVELLEKVQAILKLEKKSRLPLSVVESIDQYNDDLGNDRWGWLLGLWLQEIQKHGSADNAVESVVNLYRFKYGKDSVLQA